MPLAITRIFVVAPCDTKSRNIAIGVERCAATALRVNFTVEGSFFTSKKFRTFTPLKGLGADAAIS